MKRWLLKFRVSSRLDSGTPLPEDLRQELQRSDELRRFVATQEKLDALLAHRPAGDAPAWLHERIMAEVRTEQRESAPGQVRRLQPWLIPAAAVGLLAVVIWVSQMGVSRPRTGSEAPGGFTSLAAAGQALEAGNNMPANVPSTLVSPLEDELNRVSRDIHQAASVVMASLP